MVLKFHLRGSDKKIFAPADHGFGLWCASSLLATDGLAETIEMCLKRIRLACGGDLCVIHYGHGGRSRRQQKFWAWPALFRRSLSSSSERENASENTFDYIQQ
jgi:hypothetical protein